MDGQREVFMRKTYPSDLEESTFDFFTHIYVGI